MANQPHHNGRCGCTSWGAYWPPFWLTDGGQKLMVMDK
jgi:hypothetical protein